MAITLKAAQDNFFDRLLITRAAEKARIENLFKQANYIKRIAQTSMRYRKEGVHSPPGKPPFAHRGGKRGPLLRKFLFSEYDRASETSIVGPIKANFGKGDAPNLEEFGGTATRNLPAQVSPRRKARSEAQARAYRQKILSGAIKAPVRPRVTVIAKYPERPYMAPALATSIAAGHVASIWANSTKGNR